MREREREREREVREKEKRGGRLASVLAVNVVNVSIYLFLTCKLASPDLICAQR